METPKWKFWAVIGWLAACIGLFVWSDYTKNGALGRTLETVSIVMFVLFVIAAIYWVVTGFRRR